MHRKETKRLSKNLKDLIEQDQKHLLKDRELKQKINSNQKNISHWPISNEEGRNNFVEGLF